MAEPRRPQIATDTVCRLVVRARQFDAKEAADTPDEGSNGIDEGFREVLEDTPDDAVYEEAKALIDDLDIDEQCELVALMWIGRGDFDPSEFANAVAVARDEHTDRTAEYLLRTPLLGDLLTEGMANYDMSCEDFEREHL